MELKEIIKRLKRYKVSFILLVVGGLIAGIFAYNIPPRYISSGTLYIKRGINTSEDYFTYEGYYAQQTALAYTNSVIALLESPDLKKTVLEEMNIPVNEENLRKLNRSITVKKTGPQVVLVTVKNKNKNTSIDTWFKLTKYLMETTQEINRSGDENLSVSLVSKDPVVRETYRSLYLFGTAGFLIGFTLFLLFSSVKEYFRD